MDNGMKQQGRHDENAAIAILNIGRMDNGMKQQAQRVYENMSLLTLDLLARRFSRFDYR